MTFVDLHFLSFMGRHSILWFAHLFGPHFMLNVLLVLPWNQHPDWTDWCLLSVWGLIKGRWVIPLSTAPLPPQKEIYICTSFVLLTKTELGVDILVPHHITNSNFKFL